MSSNHASRSRRADEALEQLGRLSLRGQSLDALLQRVVDLSKSVLPGEPEASIFIRVKGRPTTVVSTGELATALDEAAELAVHLTSGHGDAGGQSTDQMTRLAPDQRYLRGLFSGGTLAYEALLILHGYLPAIYPNILPSFSRGDRAVKCLFSDPKKEEIRYYRDTGIFPIMHTVVIKQGVVDQFPWVAKNLQDAFQKAKEMCYRRMEDPRKIALAWVMNYLQEQKQILGDDPWVYGLPQNQNNLESLITYAHEQGLIHRKLELEELFIQSASDPSPQYL